MKIAVSKEIQMIRAWFIL